MAVCVFSREDVLSFREWAKVILLNEADGQVAVLRSSAAPISQEEVFRKRVSLVPSIGHHPVRTCALFRTAQSFFWKIRQSGLRRAPVHIQRFGTLGKFVRIDQAATGFVVGVRGKMVSAIELSGRFNRFA